MGLWDVISQWFNAQGPEQAPTAEQWLQALPGDSAPYDPLSRGQYAGARPEPVVIPPHQGYQPPGPIPSGAPLQLPGGPQAQPPVPMQGGEFGAPEPPIPGMPHQLSPVTRDAYGNIVEGQPQGPEAWEFPLPSTGEIDMNQVIRDAQVAEIEAATANNWGRGTGEAQMGPMEQYLSAYDERTNAIIEQMQEADRRNKWAEMGAAVLDAGIGNYTGAISGAAKVGADYARRPGAYESFRAERDTGKLDDLYKIAQSRKAMQGNQPQLSAKDQMALQFAEDPNEVRRILGIGDNFKPVQFADGVGGYFFDQTDGSFMLIGDSTVYNIHDPQGSKVLQDAQARALAMTPQAQKAAAGQIEKQSSWNAMVEMIGPQAARILATEPAQQEQIMRVALETVIAQLGGGAVLPPDAPVDAVWAEIMQAAEQDPALKAEVTRIVRQSVGQ